MKCCKAAPLRGVSQGEFFFGPQPKLLYDHLQGAKDYLLFTNETTAADHVQEGAHAIANHYFFPWIEDNL